MSHFFLPQLVLGRANRSELPDLEGDRYLFPANTVGKLATAAASPAPPTPRNCTS